MPIGFDQVRLLTIKQASQKDPAAAAMAAAAKQVPSAMPVPAYVPPADQAPATDGADAAKVEEQYKKEIERKDKELNTMRNNAQVLQMNLAHQKALAQLDKHRAQIYKSIEQKESEHRKHIEQEEAKLRQQKERMQAEEIKHQAKMDVVTAHQQAQAAEAQAKMTAQYAQQSAQDYMKMVGNAHRDADNYFGERAKDFDKRQKELDAQQKKLDEQGSRISPVVMNSLQRAVDAVSGLGAIRSKLQATPGVVASSSLEQMAKGASAYPNSEAFRYFLPTKEEKTSIADAQRLQGVVEYFKAQAAKAKQTGDKAAYEKAMQQLTAYSGKLNQVVATAGGLMQGRELSEQMLDKNNPDMKGIDAAKLLTTQQAADSLLARQRHGETLSQDELIRLKALQSSSSNIQKYYKRIARNASASEADRLKATGELALLENYATKRQTGHIGRIQSMVGSVFNHPEWGTQSMRDKVIGPNGSRDFLPSIVDDSTLDWTVEQGEKAVKDWQNGKYFSSVRHGAKSALGGVTAFTVTPLVSLANKLTGAAVLDNNGTGDAAKQVASRLGTKIGLTGVEGGTAAARAATEKALSQANLPQSTIGSKVNDVVSVVPSALMAIPAFKAFKFIKPVARFAQKSPKLVSAYNKVDKALFGNWKRMAGTAGVGMALDALHKGGMGSSAVTNAAEALSTVPESLNKSGAVAGTAGYNAQGGAKMISGQRPSSFSQVNTGYDDYEYGNSGRRIKETASPVRYWSDLASPVLALAGINIDGNNSVYKGYRTPIMLDRVTNAAYNTPAANKATNPHGLTREGQVMYNAYNSPASLAERININPMSTYIR